MKTTMKKWMLTLVCLLFIGTANAGNDKPIRLRQMPVAAQQLIKKNFNGRRVALAKAESKSYEVVFTNGDKVEFDRDGRWKEISCKQSSVPPALVPAAISRYVKSHYAGRRIVKLERDRKEFEVNLDNGVEISFNKNFQVTDIDL